MSQIGEEEAMIGTSAPPLTTERAIQEIHDRPGIIPVDIDTHAERLVWMDIEDTRLEESYFFSSTQRFQDQTPDPFRFSTDLEILDREDIIIDSLYPTGFIYHMGRCGSTLLSKALSRASIHLVISEAPPHYLFWPLLQGSGQRKILADEKIIRRFRNLTLLMGCRRRKEHSAHFVKFTTYNVLFIDIIRSAFPDVPTLFLYRDPAEVMVSMIRQEPGWGPLKNSEFGSFLAGCTIDEVEKLSQPAFYAQCLNRFMEAAYEASTEDLSLANYNLLRRDVLPTFLATLHCQADAQDLRLMQEQFDFYSKDETGKQHITPDSAKKKQEITPEIDALVRPTLIELYQKLENAGSNLANC